MTFFGKKAPVVATSILLLAGLIPWMGCKRVGSRSSEIDYLKLRQTVIDDVKNGTIKEDSFGKAVLPKDLEVASLGGYVYISRDPSLGLEIVFLDSAPAVGANEIGTLYCEGDISAQSVTAGGFQWRLERPGEKNFWMVSRM
jgi:hypothetical protein